MNTNSVMSICLWFDCDNNCSFCFQKNIKEKTTLNDRICRIARAIDFIKKEKNHTKITIMGGEIFQGQLKGCEKYWLTLIEAINNNPVIEQYIINTNLIGDLYYLDETIEHLKKDFIIGTSYDTFGRFHTEQSKQSWVDNVNKYLSQDCKISCTCAITEDLLHDDLSIIPEGVYITLYETQHDPFWTTNVYVKEKLDYRQKFVDSDIHWNMPLRKSFLKWGNSHKTIIQNYLDYDRVHADDVVYVTNDGVIPIIEERMQMFGNKCKHGVTCLCYKDSDKCVLCDCEQIVENFDE